MKFKQIIIIIYICQLHSIVSETSNNLTSGVVVYVFYFLKYIS